MHEMQSTSRTTHTSRTAPMHAVLDDWCDQTPDHLALRFLADDEAREQTASFAELSLLARRCASGLLDRGLKGKPVLLALPPGLEFVGALFGCWHAGAIAVPIHPPKGSRHRERFRAVLANSGARHAIVSNGSQVAAEVSLLDIAALLKHPPLKQPAKPAGFAPCILQYTSGSTATPKGVMIHHGNLRAHFRSLSCYQDLQLRSALSWLPPYHDMGLVLKILYAIEAGIPLTLFSPDQFIQRPSRWLKAISRYRAEMSGAPNFAYEACVRSCTDEELASLDLSCWKAAPCGAERIRPETLERFATRFAPCGFRKEAFLPGYGLAETTLIVSARRPGCQPYVVCHPQAGPVVSCGPPLAGNGIRITDPLTGDAVPDRSIGEIRVKGAVVSNGYWGQPRDGDPSFEGDELKTGDLGFIDKGELFVTGRLKDLIIIDGVNYSPEDIEAHLLKSSDKIIAVAVFPMEEPDRETFGIALEVSTRPDVSQGDFCEVLNSIVVDQFGIAPALIHVTKAGLLPRTTSGKIRRHACANQLTKRPVLTWRRGDNLESSKSRENELEVLMEIACRTFGRPDLKPEDDLAELAVGSLDATRFSAQIGARFGVHVPVGKLFATGTFRQISALILESTSAAAELPRISEREPPHQHALTHAQERMWYLHQLSPHSSAYHVFGSVELVGPLDVNCLQQAFAAVTTRHEMLNSRHGQEGGAPVIRFVPDQIASIEEMDASSDSEVETALREFSRRPFALESDIPIRAVLLRLSPQRHILAISAHHIVADGWSMRLLARDLAELYSGSPEMKAAPSYLEYARSHRDWVERGSADSQIAYWRQVLSNHPGVSPLPTDFPRPNQASFDGGFVSISLPAELVEAVANLSRKHRTTAFTVHLSLFLLLLRQHGGGNDHVIAVPVANRNHLGTTDLVGTLVNTLPFRMRVSADENFAELLEKVKSASFEMLENQDAPFELIIDAVKPERSSDLSPITQVMFDHQEIPLEQTWDGGINCRPHHAHRGAAQFDLSLLLTSYGHQHQLGIEYRSDLFRESTVEAMLSRYIELLRQACRHPQSTIQAISHPPEPDLIRLDEISKGAERTSFLTQTPLDLVNDRMIKHPERIAVIASGQMLTYGDLEQATSRLSAFLLRAGISRGDRIALLLERTHMLPAAVLALWKIGAAYVPLDPANPAERLRLILSDQDPVKVLTSPTLAALVPDGFPLIQIGEHQEDSPPVVQCGSISPDDTAYLIYTSGSTGKPKGVVITHESLANFLLSMAETPGFTETDRLLAVTTISFDISCLELFLPLITGGSVWIADSEESRNGRKLAELLSSSGASVMQATPATWRLLLESGWKGSPSLKMLCGGEALDPTLARTLVRMGSQLWNLYGPTETTVWSTCWRVPDQPDQIRIGSPIANTGIHILSDEDEVLPPGATGHLWISGAGLALGYWGNSALTSEKFKHIRKSDGRFVIAYHTGDLARWNGDGNLECLGRTDGQIKIRGFRVELGEIEAVMNEHPHVALAKAGLRNGSKLVAWVKPDKADDFDINTIRAHLAARLPSYMIPSDFALLVDFPLTSSGKVDLQQLPTPGTQIRQRDNRLTPTEHRMTSLWCELLERSSVSPDDNWFHIGGHSLLALRLFARIHQEFGHALPLSAILEHPSPRELAALIDIQSNQVPQ